MTLQVIGAGFGRTGAYSLKAALERLGFDPCEHMIDLFAHPERFALWLQAAEQKQRGGAIDWDLLFADYRATVDWPGAYFWRELARAYPNAKVILTVRDPERWYDSAAHTIFRVRRALGSGPIAQALQGAVGAVSPNAADGLRMVEETIWQGTFDGRFGDRRHAIAVYEAHNAAVERTIAPDRLLVYNVGEGWEPLCRFLGVPVPDEPFPHLNDAAEFERLVRQQLAPVAAVVAAGAVLTAGALAALLRAAARRAASSGGAQAASTRRARAPKGGSGR
ncbi:MAG: sulfotransferase family protein [Thermomicrobiales bacterium]|nr:sulfotransferase family protein [Thermomicrobiales bacterium]